MTISFWYSIISRIPWTSLLLFELIPFARDLRTTPFDHFLRWLRICGPKIPTWCHQISSSFKIIQSKENMSSDFNDFNVSHIFTFIRARNTPNDSFGMTPISPLVRWALAFPPSLFLGSISLHIPSYDWMNAIENILNFFILTCFWTLC